jgi:diaminopimelate epimerase
MNFVKMHGCGNDYLLIEALEREIADPPELSRRMSNRHFGVGSDGIILILPSGVADVRMRIFNADGSEAEMCGNGIRCLGKYVYEHGIVHRDTLAVETPAGIIPLELSLSAGKVTAIRAGLGKPVFQRKAIPMGGEGQDGIGASIEVEDRTFRITALSLGNPHCVLILERLEGFPVERYGPQIEHHPLFPARVNVEFAEVCGPGEIRLRVWERGSGETLACGTGAAATLVACHLDKKAGRSADLHLLGGDLRVEWAEDGHLFLTGPAVEVFRGEIPDDPIP